MKANFDVIDGGAEAADNGVGSKTWQKKVRSQAKELAHSIETSYLSLAEILFTVYDTPVNGDRANGPVFAQWGFRSFRDYAEQELGLHYKKAERLRLIWYRLEVELADMETETKSRLVNLGWSKVRELCRPGVLNLRNAKAWVEKAENMNYQTLDAAVRKYLDRQEDEEIERVVREDGDPIEKSNKLAEERTPAEQEEHEEEERNSVSPSEIQWEDSDQLFSKSFAFHADQIETVKLALKRAEELSGRSAGGHNLSLICLDYLATNDFTKASEEQRLRYVAKLEKSLGLKFVVVDPVNAEVVYGLSILEKLAKAAP